MDQHYILTKVLQLRDDFQMPNRNHLGKGYIS